MKVEPIQPQFRGYRINAKENKHVEYLYNRAKEIITTEQQTSVWTPTEIKFDKLTDKMKEMFEKFKIKVRKDEK